MRAVQRFAAIAALLAAVIVCAPAGGAEDRSREAVSIELDGTIDPASARWIDHALDAAADDGAALAIIRLDTPGGLDSSLREIVKSELAAPMPVVVYVSPDGARAASAGVFVTEGADVAAMAPQTNIGSASAITATGGDIGDTLGRKIENDASAYVRALADTHGRNPDLAERMVREATNVTASEALDAGLIDLVAGDQAELLRRLDGFRVEGPKAQTLQTADLNLVEQDEPLQYRLLQLLVNPNISFLLIIAGIVGLAIEIFSPGLIVPGALGLVSFVLGMYGSAQLPVTAAGVLLLAVGFVLIVAEAHLPTHGLLGVGGVIALAVSGLILYDTGSEGFGISPALVIGVALGMGGALAVGISKALAARRAPVSTGYDELVGREAEVRVAIDPGGQVFVDGGLWRAVHDPQAAPIAVGARVRVASVDGLTLTVEPVQETRKGD